MKLSRDKEALFLKILPNSLDLLKAEDTRGTSCQGLIDGFVFVANRKLPKPKQTSCFASVTLLSSCSLGDTFARVRTINSVSFGRRLVGCWEAIGWLLRKDIVLSLIFLFCFLQSQVSVYVIDK